VVRWVAPTTVLVLPGMSLQFRSPSPSAADAFRAPQLRAVGRSKASAPPFQENRRRLPTNAMDDAESADLFFQIARIQSVLFKTVTEARCAARIQSGFPVYAALTPSARWPIDGHDLRMEPFACGNVRSFTRLLRTVL